MSHHLNIQISFFRWVLFLSHVSHFAAVLNSSINFLIYCFVGRNFRREFFKLINIRYASSFRREFFKLINIRYMSIFRREFCKVINFRYMSNFRREFFKLINIMYVYINFWYKCNFRESFSSSVISSIFIIIFRSGSLGPVTQSLMDRETHTTRNENL